MACDAGPNGIGAVLSNVVDDVEHPIAYVSRSLTKAEQMYSQLDKEALAIVFTVHKFHVYLFGRHFQLVTDNKPLSRIFHERTAIPLITAAHLSRYASFLSGFDYTLVHHKGENNSNANFLSVP